MLYLQSSKGLPSAKGFVLSSVVPILSRVLSSPCSSLSALEKPLISLAGQLRLRHGIVLVLLLFAETTALAQAPVLPPDPYRFVLWTGGDVKALANGALSPRVLYAAASMGGVVLLLSGQDADLTEGAVDLVEGTDSRVRKTLNEIGNVKAVRPMALILFLGSLTSRSRRLQDATFTSLEAIVISNLISNVLKSIVGRARPSQGQGATHFQPFSGDTSFPSGHATTVFAFTTPWLLYYGNVPTIGLFMMGAGTALVRMADNVHWFTDVLVGSAIGFTTAYGLTRRHQREGLGVSITPVVSTEQAGVSLRVVF